MNDENALIEWTINYVKFRDLMKRSLKDYRILKNFIEFEFKDKSHTYYIYEDFGAETLKNLKDEWISFVVLNREKNVEFLAKHWDDFIKFQRVNILFVHPGANQNWVINPHVHDKICERKKLKAGLLSLFDGVKEV